MDQQHYFPSAFYRYVQLIYFLCTALLPSNLPQCRVGFPVRLLVWTDTWLGAQRQRTKSSREQDKNETTLYPCMHACVRALKSLTGWR